MTAITDNIVFPFASLVNEEAIRNDLSYAIIANDIATNDMVEMFIHFGYTSPVEAAQDCTAYARDFVLWLEANKTTERPFEPYAWHWLTQIVLAYKDCFLLAYKRTVEPPIAMMFWWLCHSVEGTFDMESTIELVCDRDETIANNKKAFALWDNWCIYAKHYRQIMHK